MSDDYCKVDGVILDRIDKAILRELTLFNCRASYRSLAKKFDLSPNTIKYRITKMIEQGVIRKFRIHLSNETTGLEAIFGLIFTDGTENSEELVSQIGRNPKIYYVLTLSATEGGAYFVGGGCRSPNELAELGAMLRRFDQVQKVELHMAFRPWKGRKIDFSKTQLKVIRCLNQNARMRIEEISERTGMAAKTVRRILKELEPGNGLYYSCRVNLSAGGMIDALLRIEWDDKMTSIDEVFHWIKRDYLDVIWMNFMSSSEPVMFTSLLLDSVLDLELLSKQVREAPFIKSTTPLIVISDTSFETESDIMLRE
ncbi:MAG: winged helix-turn-helix transcriptional regulator, partial [Candidatus Thorarchaeota archaeon]